MFFKLIVKSQEKTQFGMNIASSSSDCPNSSAAVTFHEESESCVSKLDFPPDFVFGVATSAYQIEGAFNEGGRGPSIWDAFSHIKENIIDGGNGDIATDHYHRYKDDVDLIAKLGFGAYRFSISWSRIFPDGLGTKINEEGVCYYNDLINALLEKGIEPYVTLYHWDLPLHLHDSIGGWLNYEIVNYFSVYADTCFAKFGDRVKKWATINEPLQTAVNGYSTGIMAPGRTQHPDTEPYLAAHHQILAHAMAVSIYRKKYMGTQGGEVGFVVDCEWAEPFSNKPEDRIAATRRLDFQLGWFLNPLFHGEYPLSMRERLGNRLPKFSEEDKGLLKNSMDFIGLNHYTTRYIKHSAHGRSQDHHVYYRAQEMQRIVEQENGMAIGPRAASNWLYVVPWGIRKLINHVAKLYGNTPIYIMENGMDGEDDTSMVAEELDDQMRVGFYRDYLSAVAEAIKDGSNVRGYFAWSLLDNYEWAQGYTKRFGLVYVDFKNTLCRRPKSSAHWFSNFLKHNP